MGSTKLGSQAPKVGIRAYNRENATRVFPVRTMKLHPEEVARRIQSTQPRFRTEHTYGDAAYGRLSPKEAYWSTH